MRRKLIAGNWKMYKTAAEAGGFIAEFVNVFTTRHAEVEVAICAPFTDLAAVKDGVAGTPIGIGAQNVHYETEGAFTGEISVPMLAELGLDYCIVGHSERRQFFAETDESVNLKVKALIEGGITPIMCVGEVLAEREAGLAEDVVGRQTVAGIEGIDAEALVKCVIAYEPVWAIGTGKTATAEQAEEMCAFVRRTVADAAGEAPADGVRILYGGSVNAENAAEILGQPNIDGALVGGASLSPEKFIAICAGAV